MSTEINESQNTAKKSGKAGKIIAGILLGGCLAGSLGLNIYQAAVPNRENAEANRKSAEFIDFMLDRIAEEDEQQNDYIEDGFKVGGEYEIRSTTQISDAYKSGDDSQLSAEDKETLNMASKLLEELVTDGMSDYEKELAVYQWMVQNIGGSSSGSVIARPGMDSSAFTPHDVLLSRNAVCVGYATTFRLFLNMMDIDCHIVHNEYHSWDLVQLDGEWYHVDIYSDAHGVMFGNFNMTDSVCENSHNWDQSALPEATAVKYSPAVQNAIPVDDVYAIPAALKAAMDENTNTTIFFSFNSPLTEEGMSMADYLVEYLRMVFYGMLPGDDYFRASWYPSDGEDYILGLLLESYDEEEPDNVDADSPEVKQIIQAIAEAFDLDPAMFGDGEDDSDFWDVDVPASSVEVVASEIID